MSKPNLKTPAISPAEREARRELADAIANADAVRKALENARKFAETARDKSFAAMDRLADARQAAAESPVSPDDLYARLAAGEHVDICAHANAELASRAELERLQEAADTWWTARETAEQRAREHEASLGFAEGRVKSAADVVLRFSPMAAELLEGLEGLHAELTRRHVALEFLRYENLLPADIADRAKSVLSMMRDGPNWSRHEAIDAIKAKHAALQVDANASL